MIRGKSCAPASTPASAPGTPAPPCATGRCVRRGGPVRGRAPRRGSSPSPTPHANTPTPVVATSGVHAGHAVRGRAPGAHRATTRTAGPAPNARRSTPLCHEAGGASHGDSLVGWPASGAGTRAQVSARRLMASLPLALGCPPRASRWHGESATETSFQPGVTTPVASPPISRHPRELCGHMV